MSTIDLATPDGASIPVEERSGDEVTSMGGRRTAPRGAQALNWAFDITPAALVTAIVTERGIVRPPYDTTIPSLLG
jgi:methylthioribose-1-phosphate isomerase